MSAPPSSSELAAPRTDRCQPAVLVSACLLGQAVRYDGRDKRCDDAILQGWLADNRVVAFCPELAGGLSTPRPPAEISAGAGGLAVLAGRARVVDAMATDVSTAFVAGAQQALALARAENLRIAVLKEGSPSCGTGLTYDGSFSGTTLPQPGVTAAPLHQAGLQVFNEHQLAEAQAALSRLTASSAE